MDDGALSGDFDVPPPSGLDARLAVLTTLPSKQLEALLAGDPVRAAPWVRATAEAGLPEGQIRYGRMLLNGEGVPENRSAAFTWFLRAANAGDAEGRNMVGRCFENGWGVGKDPSEAAVWFGAAAGQGHAWARYNLGHLYLNGLGVTRDRDRAFALYRQAAEAGHVRAMNLVARCLEEGWGVKADPVHAQDWYRRSAEGGYFRGQYNYATLLARAGDRGEAATWFERGLAGAPPATRMVMAQQLTAQANPTLSAIGKAVLESLRAAE